MNFRALAIGTAIAACTLFAGCYHPDDTGTDNGDGTPPSQTTVGDLATGQIKNKTCDQGTPAAINDLSIVDSDAAVDVSTLTPGCTGG
ncbi:hypothetical protein [Solimonas terrae]|uniref:Secreted protein n=1 Tax=Solimonas terrae TaxID=1396819 RepID=A0A6M2BV98_9GAMM|nr:hypothetical protein [Solimonas terrae]NGY06572.1 hypothetical protein [Solimonas terrae]